MCACLIIVMWACSLLLYLLFCLSRCRFIPCNQVLLIRISGYSGSQSRNHVSPQSEMSWLVRPQSCSCLGRAAVTRAAGRTPHDRLRVTVKVCEEGRIQDFDSDRSSFRVLQGMYLAGSRITRTVFREYARWKNGPSSALLMQKF
jgi:hypothetical protein